MTRHLLLDRTESEVSWHRRRGFIQAAAAFVAWGGAATVAAQGRSNIVELRGEALLNGQRLLPDAVIQTGDSIETGPGANLVFTVGNSAFLVRQSSRLTVERGLGLNTVSVLRMVTGAVASVWGRGSSRQIVTPTLTAGIRGTGVYTEVLPAQGYRSYFCNCYGVVDMSAGDNRTQSRADYHQAFWGEAQPRNGRLLTVAPPLNHTDEELEMLAALINQRTAWQIAGRKGVKDGRGYLDAQPESAHPAAPRTGS